MSTKELQEALKNTTTDLQSLHFAHAVSPLENPTQIKKTRRHVARLKTMLHSRSLQQAADLTKEGNLNQFTARQVLSQTQFPTPMNLAKLKRVISKTNNK